MTSTYGINVAQEEKDLHPVFKTDPHKLWNYVNKRVILSTSEGVSYEGYVYTIDPVTHSWVLFSCSNDEDTHKMNVVIVMNTSVTDVNVFDEECPSWVLDMMSQYGKIHEIDLSASQIAERRDAVCRWFGANRIPVNKSADTLTIANGTVTIEPPYFPENCSSSNEIILCRWQSWLAHVAHRPLHCVTLNL